MNVLLINGSPKVNGNTAFALEQMAEVFAAEGIETEIIQVGSEDIRGCIGCGQCYKAGKCVFDDLVNEVGEKLAQADGIVVGSPVYYASPNGTLISFLDRLFYSASYDLRMKVGAGGGCPPGRLHRSHGCAEQILHHFPDARCFLLLLEHDPRCQARRGISGPRGYPDHAYPSQKHGIHDAGHRPGEGRKRPSPAGTQGLYQLYSLRRNTMLCTIIDIRGDYAFVRYESTGVVSEVAIALLPFGADVGDKLKFEDFEFTMI